MTTKNIGSGTAIGLVEYLDNLVTRGRATPGAVLPLKTAFVKVLEVVDGKDWQLTQVDSIDINDYVNRFANLTRGSYTNGSITTYKSRIVRVVGWYKKFMAEPGWMPLIKARTPRQKKNAPHNQDQEVSDSQTQPITGGAYAPARTLPSGIMVVFPKSMDAEVSFGGFGEELKKLDEKGLKFAGESVGGTPENSD